MRHPVLVPMSSTHGGVLGLPVHDGVVYPSGPSVMVRWITVFVANLALSASLWLLWPTWPGDHSAPPPVGWYFAV